MKKNKISKNWINKQKRDIYVRQSKVDGYRARSAYKLIEIDKKFKIFKNGMFILDIGAAPGSWSQYASKTIKLSLDSFRLDKGLKTFTSLNIFFPSATISLKVLPMKIFEMK